MQYDVATKVLTEKAPESMLEIFLGIEAAEIEFEGELPQESVSLKRSDYILRITDKSRKTSIVIWEYLSKWKKKAVLNLIDYTVRAKIKFGLPVVPVIFLLTPSESASDYFEEIDDHGKLTFKFILIRVNEISARKFMQDADIRLFPFVPLMKEGSGRLGS